MRFNLPAIARSERDCSGLGRSGRGALTAGWGWLAAAIAAMALTGCASNPWLGPEIKHAGPLPDATALINECIRAQGGSDAAGNITSAMHSGTVVVPQLGLSGTFTIWQRNHRMVVQEAEINGLGRYQSGTNGDIGWSIAQQTGVKLMSPVELDHFLLTNEIGASTNIAKGCDGATVTRMVMFAGQPAWEVVLACPEGRRTIWISTATNLPIGFAIVHVAQNAVVPTVGYMDEWMDFEGLRMPRLVATRSGWVTVEMRTMFSSAVPIGKGRFEPPAAVCAMAGLPPPSSSASAAGSSVASRATVSQGTGFFINRRGLLITADHVIEDASTLTITDANGKQWQASVVQRAANIDLAVLKIDGDPPGVLSFADSSKLSLGQPVFTVGFPLADELGNSPKYTEGTVSSTRGPGDDAQAFQVSIPLQGGNSGGPIVDQRGRVVGVVSFGLRGTAVENVSWGVKGNLASALLGPDDRERQGDADDREEAIRRATQAVCRIEGRR